MPQIFPALQITAPLWDPRDFQLVSSATLMMAEVQRLTVDNEMLLSGKLQALHSCDQLRKELEALRKQKTNGDKDVIDGFAHGSEIDELEKEASDAYMENVRMELAAELSLSDMVNAVRPHAELFDDAHPRAKDEAHIKALWEQLKLDTQIEHIANRWGQLKKALAAGKTEAAGFYAKELEWLRPHIQFQQLTQFLADKSAAAGWAPQPAGGTDPPAPPAKMPSSKTITGRKGKLIDRATRQQIEELSEKKQLHDEEEHMTCMLGSMLGMLREMPAERRWDAYDKFRELFVEVNAEEKQHDEKEEDGRGEHVLNEHSKDAVISLYDGLECHIVPISP